MAREAPEIPTSSAASRIPLFGLRFARERRIRNDVLEGRESFSTRRLVVPAAETSGMREPVVSDSPEEWDPPRALRWQEGVKRDPTGPRRRGCRVGHHVETVGVLWMNLPDPSLASPSLPPTAARRRGAFGKHSDFKLEFYRLSFDLSLSSPLPSLLLHFS